jgi:hypothetical protein
MVIGHRHSTLPSNSQLKGKFRLMLNVHPVFASSL